VRNVISPQKTIAVASANLNHGGLTPAALGCAFVSRWKMFDSRNTSSDQVLRNSSLHQNWGTCELLIEITKLVTPSVLIAFCQVRHLLVEFTKLVIAI
jgi:hypothetical protein